jgi:hypothetical protein
MHWQPMGMTVIGRSGAADTEEIGAIIFRPALRARPSTGRLQSSRIPKREPEGS